MSCPYPAGQLSDPAVPRPDPRSPEQGAAGENKIKLNGKKQPLSTRVMAGDEIKLFILDEVLDADRRVDGPAWKNARGPAQVVYDCPQILIVNKPAGLAVDGPEGRHPAEPCAALPEPEGRI